MRRLSDSYWDNFKKNKTINTKSTRDGHIFEDLVEELLIQMFPYGEWRRTKKSHDDNRDFYLSNERQRIWAECKNFSDSISLKIIAPTLVMARAYSVNKILFFSYSKINKNTRKKLALYAEKTNSEINIYDDRLLDEMVLAVKDTLSSKFKPKPEDIIYEEKDERSIDVVFYTVRDVVFGAVTDDELMHTYEKTEYLDRFSPFELIIYVDVPDNRDIAEVLVSIPDVDDNAWFENLHPKMSGRENIDIKTSSQNSCIRIPLKPIMSAESVLLPQVSVRVTCNGKTNIFNSPVSKTRLLWNNEVELTGNEYRSCVQDFNNTIIDRTRFCCFALQGRSGIGKSRLLREMRDKLIVNGYRIVSFMDMVSEDITILLREILAFLYDIPSVDISSMIEDDVLSENESSDGAARAYRIINIINRVGKEKLLDMKFIDMIAHLIAEKASERKTAIIIDDLQKYGDTAIAFFSRFIEYANAMRRPNQSVFIFSYNYERGNESVVNLMKMVSGANNDNSCFISLKISGFDRNESESFLRNILSVKDDKFVPLLRMILNRYDNPYMIKSVVKQLISSSCIILDGKELSSIPKPDMFKRTLEKLPTDMYELMVSQYKGFVENHGVEEKDVLAILSLISLIPKATRNDISTLSLDVSVLDLLCGEYILYETDNGRFKFVHEQFEIACIRYKEENYFQIINKVVKSKLINDVKRYPLLYALCTIKTKSMHRRAVIEWSSVLTSIRQREVCSYYIYKSTISYILEEIQDDSYDSEAVLLAMDLCYSYRNIYGYEKSLLLFDIINKNILKVNYDVLYQFNEFRVFVDTYADTMRIVSRTDEALTFLQELEAASVSLPDDDQKNALLALIYNREMVVYRDFDYSNDNEAQIMTVYNKSMYYAERINDQSLREEMIYLNESDLGYLYYTYNQNSNKIISLWGKCLTHDIKLIPSKILNIYRKTAQLCLIKGDVEGARTAARLIREYLLNNDRDRNHLVFSIFLKKLDIVCRLLERDEEDFSKIDDCINEVMTMDMLKNPMKVGDSFILKGIFFFYAQKYNSAIECFNEALILMENVPTTLNRKAKMDQINQNINQCRSIKNCASEKKSTVLVNGILKTQDGLLNLPLLV